MINNRLTMPTGLAVSICNSYQVFPLQFHARTSCITSHEESWRNVLLTNLFQYYLHITIAYWEMVHIAYNAYTIMVSKARNRRNPKSATKNRTLMKFACMLSITILDVYAANSHRIVSTILSLHITICLIFQKREINLNH